MVNLFEKYNINEISQKTHISPVTLNKLKDFNLKNIDRIKLKGFIKILETEYPDCDFSKLKEHIEIESQMKNTTSDIKIDSSDNNSFKIYLLVISLIFIIAFLIYYMNKNSIEKIDTNITDNNVTFLNLNQEITSTINEINETNMTTNEKNNTLIENIANKSIQIEKNQTLAIIPLKKVWYKIYYLDNDKTEENLTAEEIDINGSKRIFIKFGHGMIKLKCNNQILEPNSTKVTRIIIDNCDMSITSKKLREFK